MKIRARYQTKEEVPESLRECYTEQQDGSWLLDVDPVDGWALENVTGLKGALAKANHRAAEHEARLKGFGDLQPDDVAAKLVQLEELLAIDPKKEADKMAAARAKEMIEQAKHKVQEDAAKAISAAEQRADRYRKHLRVELVQNRIGQAIDRHNGIAELLLPIVEKRVDMLEDGDQPYAAVLGDNGEPMLTTRSGSTDRMSIDEYVAELAKKEVFQPCFRAKQQSGGGAAGGQGGGAIHRQAQSGQPQRSAQELAAAAGVHIS